MGGTYAASRLGSSKREGRFSVGFGVGHINKAQPIWSWLRPPFIPISRTSGIINIYKQSLYHSRIVNLAVRAVPGTNLHLRHTWSTEA